MADCDTQMAALAIDDAPAPKITPMDTARRHCLGAKPTTFKTYPEGTWFLCGDEPVCKFCKDHLNLKVVPVEGSSMHSFFKAGGSSIRCGAATINLGDTTAINGAFRAFVHSKKHTAPFYIARAELDKAKQGVGIYALPTQTDFELVLMLDPTETTSNTAAAAAIMTRPRVGFNPDCFQVEEITVGERKVDLKSLNLDNTIITGKVCIDGFAAGEGNSFKFVSVTKGEKERKEVDAKVLAGYCEDNKIRCVLQKYKRTKKAEPYRPPSFGFGSYEESFLGPAAFGGHAASFGGGARGGYAFGDLGKKLSDSNYSSSSSSSSFRGDDLLWGSEEAPQSKRAAKKEAAKRANYAAKQGSLGTLSMATPTDLFSMDLLGSSTGGPGTPLPQAVQQTLSGGTTISGNQSVSAATVHSTEDKFEKVGAPVEIVLQLGCFQTDVEKEADNKRMQLHEDGYDYWGGVIHKLLMDFGFINSERNKLDAKEKKLYVDLALAHKMSDKIRADDCPALMPFIDPDEITPAVKQQLKELEREKQEKMMLTLE